MNVTDSRRASSAVVLVIAGVVGNLVLTLLAYAVNWLMPGGPFPVIQELLWLATAGVIAVGLFQVASVVDEPLLMQLTGGVMLVHALIDAAGLLMERVGLHLPFFYDISILLAVGARGLLLFVLIRLTMKTHAWVAPLLATVAVLTVARSAFSLASIHQLVSPEFYRSAFFPFVFPLMSLFNSVAIVVAAVAAKGALSSTPNSPAQVMASAGLQPAVEVPVAPGADFLVGAILLLVGIGVTVVSMEAASSGGRYVVATGAIGVGAGRIIRGFIRLGRNDHRG